MNWRGCGHWSSSWVVGRISGVSDGRHSRPGRRSRAAGVVVWCGQGAAAGSESQCCPTAASSADNAAGGKLAAVDCYQEHLWRSCRWQKWVTLSVVYEPFDANCCHMGTSVKHPVPDRVKLSSVIFDIWALWRSALSVRVPGSYRRQLNPVWHRMLYSYGDWEAGLSMCCFVSLHVILYTKHWVYVWVNCETCCGCRDGSGHWSWSDRCGYFRGRRRLGWRGHCHWWRCDGTFLYANIVIAGVKEQCSVTGY